MARIVLGVGTSHSSQLSLDPSDWPEQAELDRRRTPYEQLLGQTPDSVRSQVNEATFVERHRRAQECIAALATAIHESRPDVLIVVGDDQEELFQLDSIPALAMTLASELVDRPPDYDALDPIRRKAAWAFHADRPEAYPIDVDLSSHVALSLNHDGFDLTIFREQPPDRTLGHAWTFVRRRLLGEHVVPMVPIFLNTYVPPNQPTPRRCVDLGAALARAVNSYSADTRIAVIASGGLSHFVVDEVLDRRVLDAMAAGSPEQLAGEDPSLFNSGTSEILNWIAVGAAMGDAEFELLDYIPAYRSLAGTGVGFAFALWHPREARSDGVDAE